MIKAITTILLLIPFCVFGQDSVAVTSPNGGETWKSGETHNITWTDDLVETVKLELYKNGNLQSLISSSTPSDGIFIWNIPYETEGGSDYKIKISSTIFSTKFDFSDNNFTIIANEVTVTSPLTGDDWYAGTTQLLTWVTNFNENVSINLFKAGVFYKLISSSTENDGSFLWDISYTETGASDYQIRIASLINSIVSDTSDFFTITARQIAITSPDGGEVWVVGTTENITWASENTIDVKIELSINNGASWSTIVASTSSTGIYPWLVEISQPSIQSLIRISDVIDININDQSDNVFTINIISFVENELTSIPNSYKLLQNYPNPFNPTTTIYYGLPEESSVRITVFDVLGNEMIAYSEDKQEAGYHKLEFDATAYRSGVYFYRLTSGDFSASKKLMLMK